MIYEYRATITRHVDGDTTHVTLDLGCNIATNLTVRWFGINAPEMPSAEGQAALAWVTAHLPVGTVCTLRTVKDRKEKYARYLGVFYDAAGTNLNALMVQSGFARAYIAVSLIEDPPRRIPLD